MLLPGTCSCLLRCKSRHRRDLPRSPTAEHHPSARYKGLRRGRGRWGEERAALPLPSPRASLSFLSTFIHNMLAFGLNKKLCSDFLKKQATIGNLDEGRGEPGGCATPSRGPGGMEPTCLAGMLRHPPQHPFISPQSNTNCSATTSSRWLPNSRLAGTLRQRDGGRRGSEGRETHLWGYLKLKLGYFKKSHPHKLQ